VVAVEADELLVGQVRHHGRVAPRVEPVGRIGQQRALGLDILGPVGRGPRALHLVEDYALVDQRLAGLIQLVVPALLLEVVRRQAREEHRVEVHIDQVVEVFQVLAGDRVDGLVGVGHRVQKGLKRALDQLDKRIFERIFARAAQHGVLEDMRDPGRVRRRRAESDPKDLVLIIILKREHLRTRRAVAQQPRAGVQLSDLHIAQQLKAVLLGHVEPFPLTACDAREGAALAAPGPWNGMRVNVVELSLCPIVAGIGPGGRQGRIERAGARASRSGRLSLPDALRRRNAA